jgi:inhibitor of KinA
VTPSLAPLGDQAFTVAFGTEPDEATGAHVLAWAELLGAAKPGGVTDVVPGYTSLLVVYDPLRIPPDQVRGWLAGALAGSPAAPLEGQAVELPVLYHPEVAPDLEPLAAEKGLPVADLVALHTAPVYRCALLGFRPGFPFLGGLDARLHAGRLSSPRLRVPAGSVGIGGRQTGVYPVESPGGWRLIGRTPVRLFDPARAQPFLVRPGDTVRFVAIDRAAYEALGGGR